MRVFIIVLVLIFSLQSWTKADDIRDFEIEGISIGDSALDFFSEKDIKKNSKHYYKNKKYTPVQNDNYPFFKTYYAVDFRYKTNDTKYKIVGLSGIIDYRNKKISECKKQLKQIFNEIEVMFPNWKKEKVKTTNHEADPSGKSEHTEASFWSNEGVIAVSCTDYSEEIGWMDHLAVSIKTKKFNEWLKIAYE